MEDGGRSHGFFLLNSNAKGRNRRYRDKTQMFWKGFLSNTSKKTVVSLILWSIFMVLVKSIESLEEICKFMDKNLFNKYIVKYLTDLLNNESPQNSWLTNIDEITIFRALLESADDSDFVETALQPAPALTWRTIGGVLDLYMFMGPSPSEVIQQYTEVIGRSFMPPYWSLGFHLCKYGYHSVNETMAVVKRMQEAKIPQVCQSLSFKILWY